LVVLHEGNQFPDGERLGLADRERAESEQASQKAVTHISIFTRAAVLAFRASFAQA
jgi:hypothetical protein